MTKDEQICHFGMEIPNQYKGFVLNREPLWSAEHFQLALHYARKYTNQLNSENSFQIEVVN